MSAPLWEGHLAKVEPWRRHMTGDAPDFTDFGHDIAILDRYLAYSTELIRLALLGIGAVGYCITTKPFADHAQGVAGPLWLALVAFMVSTLAGLLHRFAGPDALADQLRARRQPLKREELAATRNLKFTWSGILLGVSAINLVVGAGAVAYSLARCI